MSIAKQELVARLEVGGWVGRWRVGVSGCGGAGIGDWVGEWRGGGGVKNGCVGGWVEWWSGRWTIAKQELIAMLDAGEWWRGTEGWAGGGLGRGGGRHGGRADGGWCKGGGGREVAGGNANGRVGRQRGGSGYGEEVWKGRSGNILDIPAFMCECGIFGCCLVCV